MALSDFRRQHGQMTGSFRPNTNTPLRSTQPAKPIAAPQRQRGLIMGAPRPSAPIRPAGIVGSAMGPMVARQ